MSETVFLKFNNCVMSATNPANTPNAVRISGTASYKITLLTVPQITDVVTYGSIGGGVSEITSETYREYQTEASIVATMGVVRINNRITLTFPTLQTNNAIFTAFARASLASQLYWRKTGATGADSWEIYPKTLSGSNWKKKDTGESPGAGSAVLRFGTNQLNIITAKATVDGQTITIDPQVFGEWETTEDVILGAVAPAQKTTGYTTAPPAPVLTTGRAQIKVEAVQ